MTHFTYNLETTRPTQLGLVVLQSDETVEPDFRRLLPDEIELLVSRVPSGDEVLPETLAEMEHDLGAATALMPTGARLAVTGYACTSGSAQIGTDRIDALLSGAVSTVATSDPVRALIAACRTLGVTRLGFVSPYVDSVSERIREVLADAGIETPVFGSFNIAEEARVARISEGSITEAARSLALQGGIDALFLSCTNLRTLGVIAPLEAELGLPVLSSNLVLAWHMCRLSGSAPAQSAPGQLMTRDL